MRRDEDHVRLLFEEKLRLAAESQAALRLLRSDVTARASTSAPAHSALHDQARAFAALPQMGGLDVAGLEKAEVVEAQAQMAGHFRPRARVAAWSVAGRDVGVAGGNALHHLPAAHRLRAIGGEHQLMTTLRQRHHRRLEEPQVGVMPAMNRIFTTRSA